MGGARIADCAPRGLEGLENIRELSGVGVQLGKPTNTSRRLRPTWGQDAPNPMHVGAQLRCPRRHADRRVSSIIFIKPHVYRFYIIILYV